MNRGYKKGKVCGVRTARPVTIMLDNENEETWQSIHGKSRWFNAQLANLKNVMKEVEQ